MYQTGKLLHQLSQGSSQHRPCADLEELPHVLANMSTGSLETRQVKCNLGHIMVT